MEKKYDPKIVEPKIQQFWEENGIFKFDIDSDKPVYSVDTPPPTVSGNLHVGHMYSYSQFEFMARFWRMRGYNVYLPFGYDNNGLASEILTERSSGKAAESMTRDEFTKLVLEVTKEYEKKYEAIFKKLGISCDWSIVYRTNSLEIRKISQRSFVELSKINRVYRSEAPSLWCPKCHTALAQVELEDKELESEFVYVKFSLKEGGEITIATTRTELLSSCVAIFVNAEDEKNKELIGKHAIVPVFGHEVPIIADHRVDPEKGTGIVMCCTFGDQTDIEWYRAHKLPIKLSIDETGKMTAIAGEYAGLKIKDAREKIKEKLEKENLIAKREKITHMVNVHERCGTEIEFYVSKQWFIKYLDLKEKFLEAANKIQWKPQHMKIRYDNWVNGLQWDWSISRQRYYGVPFPVWYCKECGEPYIATEEELPVDPLVDKPKDPCKCGHNEFEPEKDIMDTWATSSLTPEINAKWGEKDNLMDKIFPMDLRPQAHDIITFWAFNTIAKSVMHLGDIPFKTIMISGHGLDPKGKKMSKSKGNVIDPIEMMDKYSADALRWWASSAKLGDDLPFQEKDLSTGFKVANKLWNASRFASMHFENIPKEKPELNVIDAWILSKLNSLVKECTERFEVCEYGRAKNKTEVFFWNEFCDNYLEMVKYRLYEGDDKSARWSLYKSLLSILRLFTPIIPHVTEEIYQNIFRESEGIVSINSSGWPEYDESLHDEEAEKCGDLAKTLIAALRQWKQQNKMALNSELEYVMFDCDEETKNRIEKIEEDLKGTMKIKNIEFGQAKTEIENTKIKFDVSA